MPSYEYRCRTCADMFTVNRPMTACHEPATCPGGHQDTVRLLTTLGLAGRASAQAPTRDGATRMASQFPTGGGGCCGGGCGCT